MRVQPSEELGGLLAEQRVEQLVGLRGKPDGEEQKPPEPGR